MGTLLASQWLAWAGGPVLEGPVRESLEKYCFKCHNEQKAKAGINLVKFDTTASLYLDPPVWENVVRQLRDRAMPPEGKTQPSTEERVALMEGLQALLDNPDPRYVKPDPGRVGAHRLTHSEYNNTVRDLLGVTLRPADTFPSDGGGGGGFDNNADTLFVPPILLEKYLHAADDVLRAAQPTNLFVAQPAWYRPDVTTARRNLSWFLRRAWRRPANKADVERFLVLYKKERQAGRAFQESLKAAYRAALISPRFLFRVEQDRPGVVPQRLDDFELASRLSYFLWSSMPDEALLKRAEQKTLGDPKVLENEVRRMLASPKAHAFSEQFVGQWLGTKSLATVAAPDGGRYPQFTPALREAMKAEPVALFESLLDDNASLLQLIDAPYTFVNGDLAKLYGLPEVAGTNLVKVNLPDRRRGGITGMAAILTQTSYPQRTSPVLRGRWILEEVMGTPPPPPPPLVATLADDDRRSKEGETFRQRLERHRKDPNCAACHSRLDPLGFCLENFDAIGRWRDTIDGAPVDASGQLVTGEKIDGPLALKKVLLAKQDLFLRHVTSKALAYALGRGLEYYDAATVKEIIKAIEKDGYRTTDLVVEVVKSLPFQYRRGTEAKPLQLAE
ncbi:MAG TPA: DUF1592 domain-containing protein [Candidatus Limnocylindria bacterium]|nr:DUF1592 domain-containing protein [Candidatus Limnocylindria bacterium]